MQTVGTISGVRMLANDNIHRLKTNASVDLITESESANLDINYHNLFHCTIHIHVNQSIWCTDIFEWDHVRSGITCNSDKSVMIDVTQPITPITRR